MTMNKDTADAAMEAAWVRFRAQSGNLDADEYGYRAGYREGYNAAMNRECDMLLYCPNCFEQHVDKAEPDICEKCGYQESEHDGGELHPFTAWLNPPHKSHRCKFCNHVWRPADVPTNGVQSLNTEGSNDGSPRPVAFANGRDFNDAVNAARNRECVWTEIGENTVIWERSCDGAEIIAALEHTAPDYFCPNCGGKVSSGEEENDD